MTRAEKVARARELRAEGLFLREIAALMGSARSTVDGWLNDPDLSQQRKRRKRYSTPCVECGKPTDGSGGFAKPRVRCRECSRRDQHENAMWTREGIVIAIREFARLYDRPPTASDFNPHQAITLGHPEWAERFYEDDCYPFISTVTAVFGRWNDAIRAAGFDPNCSSHYGRAGEDMALCQEIRERYEAGERSGDLAGDYSCAPSTVLYRVRKAGGQLRAPGRARVAV